MITEAIRVTDRWRRILQAKLRKAEAARDLVAIAILRAALAPDPTGTRAAARLYDVPADLVGITETELRMLHGDR